MMCSTRGGVVRLDFGCPVDWIGMGPEEARKMARSLNEHADEAETNIRLGRK